MLEFKSVLKEGDIKEFGILVIKLRKSYKLKRSVIKKNREMRKLILMGLFNPRYVLDFEDILRVKRTRSALYNILFALSFR
ncbi:MAG: hypothetical protein ACW98X_15420 [Promethearchaeota archaeon]